MLPRRVYALRCVQLFVLILVVCAVTSRAQTTSFTYQGKLSDGGGPATGSYDFQFTLWDALSGGTQQPQPSPVTVTKTNVAVSGGVFTVQLDFGATAFPGADRYLEIGVRPTGGGGFTILSPPQNVFYNFIDRLAVLQITLGCTPDHSLYCPRDPVQRQQMAAFLLRALGEFNPPTPASQRFGDVPSSNVFYNFIDRMAVVGITQGCTPDHSLFCPNDSVTRAQMAAFLVRAFNL